MAYATVLAGWILIGIAAAFARRVANLDAQLRLDRRGERRGPMRWPADDLANFRLAVWPVFPALRLALAGAYLCGLAGLALLMYGCPRAPALRALPLSIVGTHANTGRSPGERNVAAGDQGRR